ncbi:hypothetical protein [Chitinibacter sp. S2-10]
MNRRNKEWIDHAVDVARHIPEPHVQMGVRIYDIVNESNSRKGRA